MKHATLKRRRLRQAEAKAKALAAQLADALVIMPGRNSTRKWMTSGELAWPVRVAAELSWALQEALVAAQWEDIEERHG